MKETSNFSIVFTVYLWHYLVGLWFLQEHMLPPISLAFSRSETFSRPLGSQRAHPWSRGWENLCLWPVRCVSYPGLRKQQSKDHVWVLPLTPTVLPQPNNPAAMNAFYFIHSVWGLYWIISKIFSKLTLAILSTFYLIYLKHTWFDWFREKHSK